MFQNTPEKIKKGLECCGKGNACRGHCPYDGPENDIKGCTGKLSRNALALINRLEGDNIAKAIVLEQLEREKNDLLEERELNDFLRDKVKELEAQLPKWISVEERLPDESEGTILVCFPNVAPYNRKEPFFNAKHDRRVTTATYSEHSKRWYIGDMCAVGEVDPAYWMPLPEPPKEE